MGELTMPATAVRLNNDDKLKCVKQIFRMVNIAAHYGLYRANCLKRAHTIWWLLKNEGIQSEIMVGINTIDDFQAHAWVEPVGWTVNDIHSLRTEYDIGALKLT